VTPQPNHHQHQSPLKQMAELGTSAPTTPLVKLPERDNIMKRVGNSESNSFLKLMK